MKIALAGPVQVSALTPWLEAPTDVLQALPPGRGGTAVTQLARGLLDRGYRVCIVSLDAGAGQPLSVGGTQLTLRLGHYRPAGRARDAFRVERRHVTTALLDEQPDVVHAHWTYEYALGALATRYPTLVSVRDWAPTILRLQPAPYRAVRLVMSVLTLARARHLTVASPYMGELVRRWTRKSAPVIPNALEDATFQRRSKPLQSGAPRLLAANSGFDRRKNIKTLLAAFAHIRREWPQAQLQLLGNGYQLGGAAEQWARQRHLHQGVDFRGPVPYDDVPKFMRRADVFVHPALEESFGMVLVEAMAQGLPVVGGANSGAVPWVLDGGRAGILTDVSSSGQLAKAIARLLNDGCLWKHYADAGFDHAYASFRLSPVVDRFLDTYRQVIAEG